MGKHAEEVPYLLFADDTILLCEPDKRFMLNLMFVDGFPSDLGSHHQFYQI